MLILTSRDEDNKEVTEKLTEAEVIENAYTILSLSSYETAMFQLDDEDEDPIDVGESFDELVRAYSEGEDAKSNFDHWVGQIGVCFQGADDVFDEAISELIIEFFGSHE